MARGYHSAVGNDSATLGVVGRMVGRTQANRPEFTGADMNNSMVKEAKAVFVTLGTLKNDLAKRYPTIDLKDITTFVKEEI